MFDVIIAWLTANPFFAVMVLYMAIKMLSPKQKFPDVPGNVKVVHNMEEFNVALKSSELVIADFYATWCPPCKTAAPVYGRLSLEYTNVSFIKCDVDEGKDVSAANKISAMPTFKLFKGGKEVETVQGFREANIIEMLEKNGAVKGKPVSEGGKKEE
jgi:thioredoxin 1